MWQNPDFPRVFKDFSDKNIGDYYYLHVQNDTLLLANMKSFNNMGLNIYELDAAHFLSLPKLAWLNCLKNWYWHATNGWKRNQIRNMSYNP